MAMMDFDNTSDEIVVDDFTPMPVDWYTVSLEKCERKDSSTGGVYLACRFTVLDPPQYVNRKIFHNFNVINRNVEAENIARKQLKSLCLSAGRADMVRDTDELIGIPVFAKLKITPAKGDYDAKNEITAFKTLGGHAVSMTTTAGPRAVPRGFTPAPAPAPATATATARPTSAWGSRPTALPTPSSSLPPAQPPVPARASVAEATKPAPWAVDRKKQATNTAPVHEDSSSNDDDIPF